MKKALPCSRFITLVVFLFSILCFNFSAHAQQTEKSKASISNGMVRQIPSLHIVIEKIDVAEIRFQQSAASTRAEAAAASAALNKLYVEYAKALETEKDNTKNSIELLDAIRKEIAILRTKISSN